VDEFLDFWHSTMHPNTIKLVQNKLMYKVSFMDPPPPPGRQKGPSRTSGDQLEKGERNRQNMKENRGKEKI
jgi:hypothetical protein